MMVGMYYAKNDLSSFIIALSSFYNSYYVTFFPVNSISGWAGI